MASFTLDTTERVTKLGTIRDVVKLAGAGAIAVFSGTDAGAKAAAAASAASELGKALVTVGLDSVVASSPEETDATLDRLFERVKEEGAVLLVDNADAVFGVRPEELDPDDPYAAIDVGAVLDRLGNAPSVVIIALTDLSGDELADRARVEVRFPAR
ncbi:AAA family ATPase [Cryobacterium sp. 10C3]|nr:AAA family ATPase [Cryobacterium sp. 10C3]MDY7555670.1 AAA family ATPase [Cryobacterium sp. 10C3]